MKSVVVPCQEHDGVPKPIGKKDTSYRLFVCHPPMMLFFVIALSVTIHVIVASWARDNVAGIGDFHRKVSMDGVESSVCMSLEGHFDKHGFLTKREREEYCIADCTGIELLNCKPKELSSVDDDWNISQSHFSLWSDLMWSLFPTIFTYAPSFLRWMNCYNKVHLCAFVVTSLILFMFGIISCVMTVHFICMCFVPFVFDDFAYSACISLLLWIGFLLLILVSTVHVWIFQAFVSVASVLGVVALITHTTWSQRSCSVIVTIFSQVMLMTVWLADIRSSFGLSNYGSSILELILCACFPNGVHRSLFGNLFVLSGLASESMGSRNLRMRHWLLSYLFAISLRGSVCSYFIGCKGYKVDVPLVRRGFLVYGTSLLTPVFLLWRLSYGREVWTVEKATIILIGTAVAVIEFCGACELFAVRVFGSLCDLLCYHSQYSVPLAAIYVPIDMCGASCPCDAYEWLGIDDLYQTLRKSFVHVVGNRSESCVNGYGLLVHGALSSCLVTMSDVVEKCVSVTVYTPFGGSLMLSELNCIPHSGHINPLTVCGIDFQEETAPVLNILGENELSFVSKIFVPYLINGELNLRYIGPHFFDTTKFLISCTFEAEMGLASGPLIAIMLDGTLRVCGGYYRRMLTGPATVCILAFHNSDIRETIRVTDRVVASFLDKQMTAASYRQQIAARLTHSVEVVGEWYLEIEDIDERIRTTEDRDELMSLQAARNEGMRKLLAHRMLAQHLCEISYGNIVGDKLYDLLDSYRDWNISDSEYLAYYNGQFTTMPRMFFVPEVGDSDDGD